MEMIQNAYQGFGFNRYIVECKYSSGEAGISEYGDLIDT